MSVKRKTFSAAAEAAISSATSAALSGTAPGVFAKHRERIAATLANPMAAGMPHAGGIDPGRIAAALEDSTEAARLAIEAAKGAGTLAKQAGQDIAGVRADVQALQQIVAAAQARGTGIIAHHAQGIGASLIQRIDAGEADGFAALREGEHLEGACAIGYQYSRRADAQRRLDQRGRNA